MMKQEFEALYGHEVTAEEYERIEYCYMCLEKLSPRKEDMANLYKLLGVDMFHLLYMDLVAIKYEKEDKFLKLEKENGRLAGKLCYCEGLLEQFKEYVNNVDFVLTNNIKYVNGRTKELLADLDKSESEV